MTPKIFKYKLYFAAIVLLTGFLPACKTSKNVVSENSKSSETANTKAVSRFPQAEQMTIDNAFLEAVKWTMMEDYNSALTAFFDVLRLDHEHAPATFEISKIKFMQQQMNDAEIFAEKAHRLSPENKFYLEHLAYVYRQNNKNTQAVKCFERLTRLDSRNDEYWIELINSYVMAGKPKDAIRICDSVEKRQGVTDEISMQKIKLYQMLGKNAEIRTEVQKLTQTFPHEIKYLALLAEMDLKAKKYEEAYATYQKMLLIDSTSPHVHLALATYYMQKEELEKVLPELIFVFQSPRMDVDTKIRLLMLYYGEEKERENVYKLLDAMMLAHSDEAKAWALYAEILQRDNRYTEARDKYYEVNRLDASNYLIWEALLLCDAQMLDSMALLKDAQEALELFPEQPLPYYMLGFAYRLTSDYSMAMQYLEQCVPLLQSGREAFKAQVYAELGDVYHELNDYEKSDLNYRKSLEIEPNNDYVLNNFAYFLSLRKENLDEAELMIRAVCQRNPTEATYLDTYAWTLYQNGKYKEAQNIMELAIEHSGNQEALLLEHYGDILWKNNETEQALEFWKQAQTLDEKACSKFLNEKIKNKTLIEN